MSKNVRTFIAVQITDEIRRRAVKLQRALDDADAKVKWVEPQNIHVTLRFLGGVPDYEIPDICNLARDAVAGIAPFTLTVEGAGCFPNARRPRVLWLGVTAGADLLVRIHEGLEARLAPLGYRREQRRFTPHLTIGRVRQPSDSLAQRVAAHDDWPAGSMQVDEIEVLSSELTPGGPQYTVMGRAPLASAG